MIRLKLTAPLMSRDGSLTKGAQMKNMLAETHGDIIKGMKRPGVALLLSGSAMQGQGCIGLGGALYHVAGDTLRKVTLSPPTASTTWAL